MKTLAAVVAFGLFASVAIAQGGMYPANWNTMSADAQAAWLTCYGALTRAADARTCDSPAKVTAARTTAKNKFGFM